MRALVHRSQIARRIIIAGGTLGMALGAGFLMQTILVDRPATSPVATASSSVVPVSRDGKEQAAGAGQTGQRAPTGQMVDGADLTAKNPDLDLSDVALTSALPAPPAEAPIPGGPDGPRVVRASMGAEATTPVADVPEEKPSGQFPCDLSLEARVTGAAMVDLSLGAPCMVNQRVTLHHHGMMITASTDESGQAELRVPALAENAVFIASFPAGDSAIARAEVTSLEFYDRVVVQWQEPGGLQVHALEYGAGYGEDGHVWNGAARDISAAVEGAGGFLARLGASEVPEARLAEVYTFPSGTAKREGRVVLSLEAEVTRGNCGRDVAAQALQVFRGAKAQAREIELAMPDCDAVGDFLVLKKALDDLKIARN
ncbi:hypothetical protein [Roseovarius salinarum]|uniref:hypothetical protein n=1 Tax=Roseovarius salinarum TaxID=1981892 RepID=UPI000C349D42|nr:hypothetical protein [Roseovarius salinarum]